MLGVALIVLWVLSPLGSQSVLRISSLIPINQNTSASVLYMDTNDWNSLPPGGSDALLFRDGVDILFKAALASSINFKQSVTDLWGHVKIPKLSHTFASEEDSDGWRPVNIGSLDDFSSLLGLPVEGYGYSSDQTLDFTVESWYWDFACSRWSNSTENSGVPEGLQFNTSWGSDEYNHAAVVIYYNLTGMYGNSDARVTRPECISDFPRQNESVECSELSARRFAVWATRPLLSGYCDISTEYVETKFTCAGGECFPQQIRQSRQPHPNRNWTIFDVQAGGSGGSAIDPAGAPLTNQGSFWNNVANALDDGPGNEGNPLAGYIVNPNQPFFAGGMRGQSSSPQSNMPSILSIEDSLITSRFAQIINSYYIASIGNVLITASEDTWKGAWERNKNNMLEFDGTVDNSTRSSAITIMTPRQKFQCSLPWLLVFTAVTLLSLISAIIGLVFTLQIRGPRLAMNITTMLRNNIYSDLGQKASYMDDDHRSRMTRETRVRIGDVAPDKDIGHIGIATVGSANSTGAGALRKGRLYI